MIDTGRLTLKREFLLQHEIACVKHRSESHIPEFDPPALHHHKPSSETKYNANVLVESFRNKFYPPNPVIHTLGDGVINEPTTRMQANHMSTESP